jgi:NAD(P)-dependent dehydrogenase (short-subunit alcohol dehydrogenase family)
MNIAGSVALVTGANRGLGKAYVEALLSSGAAKVYAGARDPSKITDSRVFPLQLYVSSTSDINAAVRQCSDVTLLVNNAGAMLKYTDSVSGRGGCHAKRDGSECIRYGLHDSGVCSDSR